MENSSFIRPNDLWRSLGLRANQTVVHLGAGAGFYIIPAAVIVGPKGKAIGIDILSDMLAEITSKAARGHLEDTVQTIRANLENTPGSPLPAESADWVLVANILHQADPDKIITEAARLCAPQGQVVIIEWDTSASPFGPPATARLPRDQVEAIAAQHGLKVIKRFTPSPYHYGLVTSPL